MGRRIGKRARGSGVVGLATLAIVVASAVAAAPAVAAPMVIQPDGKIVLAGRVWPEAGAIARLQPDGSLDPSFGQGGFVIDHRLTGIRALALQPDGRIVGAAMAGLLGRYLPDGTPDPSFGGSDGVGGSDEADQPHFLYSGYGPSAVVLQPTGGIVVASTHAANEAGATDGLVRRYDALGHLLETAGYVPLPSGALSAASLYDLVEAPDGSLIGVGSGYGFPGSNGETKAFLARFLPASGTAFDPGFGAGAGLVRPSFLSRPRFSTFARAVVASGDKLLVAGGTGGTFLLARFNHDGTLDSGFGENGFAAPPISGPGDAVSQGAIEPASTWANDLAVGADGGIVLAGGTSQWGNWTFTRDIGAHCTDCPQPMLARFDAGGHLDPGFGSGGLLRLPKPDGSVFQGEIEEVVALADGKLLLAGRVPARNTTFAPFVARLNSDGSYDTSFGQGGLALPEFPCTDQPEAELRRSGCVASLRATLRLSGLRRGHPVLSLRARPSLPWAALRTVTLTLPGQLRLAAGFRSKLRIATGGSGKPKNVLLSPPRHGHPQTSLLIRGIGKAPELRLSMGRGALRAVGRRLGHRRLVLEVGAEFSDARWGTYAGRQTLRRRAG